MIRFVIVVVSVLFGLSAQAQKKIYIPEDLRGMDLQADTSKWSFKRSIETDDLIFMWERGFGNDTSNPPQLEGKPMSFSLENLKNRMQSFYHFFRDTLGFVQTPSDSPLLRGRKGYSKADRYKMMVMVMYSLDGTAYGGTYDNFMGALWVAPNRIQDEKMNCMAHELGHSFQLQIPADSVGDAWGGSGFFEMTSQWMLWQVNPDWLTDENYHFEAFKKLTHKAYLHLENIYHSPYVIQWWSDLHGRRSIAELYRQGKIGEDPAMTYKRLYGLSQQQFCDEMFKGYQHLVNFDFKHARKETRQYACTFNTKLETSPNPSCRRGNVCGGEFRRRNDCPPPTGGVRGGHSNCETHFWLRPKDYPEEYGFNAILLDDRVNLKAKSFDIRLRGDNMRFGFVGITTDDEEIYSDINATRFITPKGKTLKHLYLIVMGAPMKHYQIPMPTEENPDPKAELQQFPYTFRVNAR